MKRISKQEVIAMTTGIIVLALVLFIGIYNSMSSQDILSNDLYTTMNQEESSGLIIEELVVGDGAEAVSGKVVTAHYVGTLDDGTVFDSSIERGPFSFVLGVGQVIKGWDMGIVGMRIGGKRKLTIPSELAYGSQAIGAIPPNSTLHFEVELLGVSDPQR